MNLQQEKGLQRAKQLAQVKCPGFRSDDETQIIYKGNSYWFRKYHKSWNLIDVVEMKDEQEKRDRRARKH